MVYVYTTPNLVAQATSTFQQKSIAACMEMYCAYSTKRKRAGSRFLGVWDLRIDPVSMNNGGGGRKLVPRVVVPG